MEEQGRGKRILVLTLRVILGGVLLWLGGYAIYVFAVI